MRGLTPSERKLLGAPCGYEVKGHELSTLGQLSQQGRVKPSELEDADWALTDMGRLALRVCPVGEP